MSTMASQITSLTIVYSTVYSGPNQRKHQSSVSLAFCAGNSPVTVEFPTQKASNAENVSNWWCHHLFINWIKERHQLKYYFEFNPQTAGNARVRTQHCGYWFFGAKAAPDSKVHGAIMGPTWVLSAPDGPHVCPINLAIWVSQYWTSFILKCSDWITLKDEIKFWKNYSFVYWLIICVWFHKHTSQPTVLQFCIQLKYRISDILIFRVLRTSTKTPSTSMLITTSCICPFVLYMLLTH